jgi:hypothetical protein
VGRCGSPGVGNPGSRSLPGLGALRRRDGIRGHWQRVVEGTRVKYIKNLTLLLVIRGKDDSFSGGRLTRGTSYRDGQVVLAIRVLMRHFVRDRDVRHKVVACVHQIFFSLAREKL